MPRALPIFSEVFEHSYDAEISGVALRVRVTWQERTRSWYLNVSKPDGTPIVRGRRVSSGRTPLEGLRVLHLIGDAEILIPIGPDPYTRTAPPVVVLVDRPARGQADDSLTITAGGSTP